MKSPVTFRWESPHPCLHPVTTPSGAVLTVDAPSDHPWHHGMWFTIKYLNGENFWEEYDEFGTQVASVIEDGSATTVQASIDWIRPDGVSLAATGVRSISISATTDIGVGAAGYVIDWRESVTPKNDTVFDRTPFTTWGGYSGWTLRGAPDFVDTRLVVPFEAHERLLGHRSPWCSLQGRAPASDGRIVDCGVLVAQDPSELHHPVPWYASTRAATYGEDWANFCNAAFLWDGPETAGAGVPRQFHYRIAVFDGVASAQECDAFVRSQSW